MNGSANEKNGEGAIEADEDNKKVGEAKSKEENISSGSSGMPEKTTTDIAATSPDINTSHYPESEEILAQEQKDEKEPVEYNKEPPLDVEAVVEKISLKELTIKKCEEILSAAGCDAKVIKHCKAVTSLARQIAQLMDPSLKIDLEVVTTGAMLHDIGRAVTHDIKHGVEGAKIAASIGLPKKIIYIIERHIGAGIPAEEAKRMMLPVKDYMPQTWEEKIVAHADNLIDHDQKVKAIFPVYSMIEQDLKEAAERIVNLHLELCEMCDIDLDTLSLHPLKE
ncbi:MAG: HDIG domain-containing protein [Thermoplasmata archaeon]